MIHIVQKTDPATVPQVFSERYATSDGPSLKVALFLLLNGDSEIGTVATKLGMSEEVVRRAVSYWESAGLLSDTETVTAVTEKKQPEKKKVMSHSEMAQAVLADPAIATLLQESQVLLGRELSISESRLFIEMFEETSLPVPVLLLIESFHAVNCDSGKVPTRTLHTAREWAELGIDTVSAAECRIELMNRREENYDKAAGVLGIAKADLRKSDRKRIDTWFEDFGYDESFIDEARLRKPDGGIPYIHAVLKDWHKKGYASIAETRTMPSNVQAPVAGASELDPFVLQVLSNLEKEEQ